MEVARGSLDILEDIDISYYELDLKGHIVNINNIACRDLGYSREELMGMNFRTCTKSEDRELLRAIYKEIYLTGKPKTFFKIELIKKDGSTIITEHSATVIHGPGGRTNGFSAVVRDVTEKDRMEQSLRESEERYRSTLETMNESLYVTDLEGNITFANDVAFRRLGYERDELMGKNFRMYHSPEALRNIVEDCKKIYKTGRPALLMEYEAVCKDGSTLVYQANIALIRDKSGRPSGFCTLAHDITERKKSEAEKVILEKQLVQAQKMESVGRLAGGVAHDFNNILTIILGYAELIKMKLRDGDPVLADILEMEKAAARSRDLTRQLLAFSRKEIISPRPVDLNSMIMGGQKTLLRLIGEDIDLRFYPGENLWTVMVDPSQIDHLLMNFAVNARDAMPDGGKLTIETENIHLNEAYCKVHAGFKPGYYVLLAISDDGVGMDRETMSHLFEPFFTTKERGKGTGLGLATVYGIVKQNNGFINVYSEPGKGTMFKIYIPRSSEKVVEQEKAEEQPPVSGTGTVFLVEDDDMVRVLTTEMLEAIGYTVIATGNPADALAVFAEEGARIDLVLTDVVMPQMSGRELGDRIAAVRPGTKVLFMSGYSADVIAHRGVLDEGVHFIQKPFSMADLANKVREAISGR